MMPKISVIIFIAFLMFDNSVTGYASLRLPANDKNAEQLAAASFEVVSNTASAFAIVNKTLQEQVKLINSLIDFSSAMSGKALPKHEKTKSAPPRASLMITATFNQNLQAEAGKTTDNHFMLNPAVMTTIAYMAILYLSVKSRKFSRFFFLLPRSSTDDAIITMKMYSINPGLLTRGQDFSFISGARHVQ